MPQFVHDPDSQRERQRHVERLEETGYRSAKNLPLERLGHSVEYVPTLARSSLDWGIARGLILVVGVLDCD
ncbi:MAG: hypothetical protein Q9209_006392 [Squamulea sp. 1 TL-2023]